MKNIFSEKVSKIIQNKKKIEKELGVKISAKEKEVSIEGDVEEEYVAEKVIDAINFGFPVYAALMIKTEDFVFEVLNIKDYTPKKDYKRIRARIIGSGGKTLKTLNELTECFFEIKENNIGIIGSPEYIKNAHDAVISIIQGSKQANVYSYLEKHHVHPVLDLGLKEKKKSKR